VERSRSVNSCPYKPQLGAHVGAVGLTRLLWGPRSGELAVRHHRTLDDPKRPDCVTTRNCLVFSAVVAGRGLVHVRGPLRMSGTC